jgi:hypothetical protein
MAARNRDLRPDPEGRYRPYLGWKRGEDGVGRQHRFNLGTDKKEAGRRFARLRELYDENCVLIKEDLWSPLALSYAEKIAKGEFRIAYPPLPQNGGFEDPKLEYAQMVHTMRGWFPSLDMVPEDPALYAESSTLNQELTGQKLRGLEVELKDLGVLPTGRALPDRLISGTLHAAFDDYESEVRTGSLQPGSSDLTPYGRLRLERVKRFRKSHDEAPSTNSTTTPARR